MRRGSHTELSERASWPDNAHETILRWATTTRMKALVLAAEESRGGGQESDLQKIARTYELGEVLSDYDRPENRSLHNHYSQAAETLAKRGVFEKRLIGKRTEFWLTEPAWRALGNEGDMAGQEGLF